MFAPRWRKVWRDLLANKTRTLLVIVSIAIGVFAVGAIAGANLLLNRELRTAYLATNPASATLYVSPFTDELIDVVRRVPGVEDAEGRRTIRVRFQVAPDDWRLLELIVISDFDDMRIHQVYPEQGDWPPPHREMLIERGSLEFMRASIGDSIVVELPDNRQRSLRIAGLAHDLNQFPSLLAGRAYGYITLSTLEWLGWSRDFDELHIVVSEGKSDVAHIRAVADAVRRKVENSGRPVNSIRVPTPGRLSVDDVLEPMVLILGALGFLSLVMSSFLVINTLTAILTQHVRQIGIMKAIGAKSRQLTTMYFAMVLILGVGALAIGLPLASLGARYLTDFAAGLLNFDVASYRLSTGIVLLQIAVGLVVPLLASVYPILRGTRLTVREAIADYGVGQERSGKGIIDRAVERIRGLSRPLLLSLRNTFRRKGRLAMTLVTLSLGGAIFVAVMSVQGSLLKTLDEALLYWNYDIAVQFDRAYRLELLEREALSVPGVTAAESWGFSSARIVREDGSESRNFSVIAPPQASAMILPTIVSGRWLVPGDESAIVINSDVLKEEPDLAVGDTIVLKIGGREATWTIVGIAKSAMTGPTIYANFDYFSEFVRSVGRSSNVRVLLDQRDPATQHRTAQALRAHFESIGLQVSATETMEQVREPIIFQFNILVVFLMIMAVLLAIVGAIGLTGTMSINVLERIREIGVMRAIGASGRAIKQLVIVEGIIVALISWVLSSIVSVPLSMFLSHIVGVAFMRAPLSFAYSVYGLVLWLGIVLVLSMIASLLPAWNAARLTVRDVLAYQ